MIKTTVHSILVPLQLNEEGVNSIKQAMVIHKRFNTKVTFLFTIPKKNLLHRMFHPMRQIIHKRYAFKKLREFVSEYYDGQIPKFVRLKVKQGGLVKSVVSFLNCLKYDLIVINKKYEQRSNILQSWESGIKLIVGEAFCPVLVFNGTPSHADIHEILVPVEINRRHKHNIVWAIELAGRYNAKIHLVAVISDKILLEKSRAHRKVRAIERWLGKLNIPCEVTFLRTSDNKPHQKLAEYINHAKKDLALVMTHQEAVFDMNYIGKTASEVIKEAEHPVFVITPKKETLITTLIDVLKYKRV